MTAAATTTSASPAPAATGDIVPLLLPVTPVSPELTVEAAADRFLQPEYARMLCLPIVAADGRPVGSLSRHTLNGIFLRRFGRELFGPRPVTQVMNAEPLVVELGATLEAAAAAVGARLRSPISEDFVIVDQGRYLGMGIVLDLTSALQRRVEQSTQELAEAYRQLQASQAQLVQSEKMASLGQMVAGVAHEINTPLGYVRNNVEMIRGVFEQLGQVLDAHEALGRTLRDEHADEAALADQLTRCGELLVDLRESRMLDDTTALFGDTMFGVDTIKDLVVNLRNFSRLDQAKVAAVSLNDCLDQTLTLAGSLLKNRVQVIKRYGEIPAVRCSPSQINQVLLNLISNAVQAIEHEQGLLLLKTESDGRWVHVHVQDNGKGIARELLPKIFDPFFTTKPVGQGTGLGLSISYQIVQAHGGRLQAVSEVGRGSKFVLSLPLAARTETAVLPETP